MSFGCSITYSICIERNKLKKLAIGIKIEQKIRSKINPLKPTNNVAAF